MPVLWSIFALLLFCAAIFSSDQSIQNQIIKEAEVTAISESLMIYRNSVAAFAGSNPSAVGVMDDSVLNLPSWYVTPPGTSHYLATGTSYVYYTQALPGLVGELAVKTESINVGTNQGGYLVSPNVGHTAISLPAQIPQAAVVIIQ
ncbi:PilM [compost metagenome]|jgi:hypothetical protein